MLVFEVSEGKILLHCELDSSTGSFLLHTTFQMLLPERYLVLK